MDDLNVELNNQQKRLNPKIIFIILGIILLIEVVYAIRVLTAPAPTPPPAAVTDVQKAGGKISLIASKTNFSVKETVPVSVMVDTGGHTLSGADLIIRYDPKILEATKGAGVKGAIFDEYPLLSVDAKNGLISISGISNLAGFAGSGQFATINLKAKSPGKTILRIDFAGNGATTDSNLVEATTSKDILEQTENISLEVR